MESFRFRDGEYFLILYSLVGAGDIEDERSMEIVFDPNNRVGYITHFDTWDILMKRDTELLEELEFDLKVKIRGGP